MSSNFKSTLLVTACSLGLLAWPVIATAQSVEERQAPPAAKPKATADDLDYSMKVFGISRAEAKERRDVTSLIETEAKVISEKFPQSFIGTIIEDKPARVVLVFDRDVSVADLNAAVSPELRRYIKIKRSKLTGEQIISNQQALLKLVPLSATSASVNYDQQTDRFEVTVAGEDNAKAVRDALPAELRPITRVREARETSVQTAGQRTGFAEEPENYGYNDVAYSGFPLFSSGRKVCTLGFLSHDYNTREAGVLTAGHCDNALGIKYTNLDGTTRSLGTIDIERDAPAGSVSYDYQHYKAPTFWKRAYLWFDASTSGRFIHGCEYNGTNCSEGSFANVDGQLPLKGWLKINYANQAGSQPSWNTAHPVGAVRCKSGMTSGYSCGVITEQTATAYIRLQQDNTQTTQYNGIVKVAVRDFMVMGYYGDSGGPVFTKPVYNTRTGWFEATGSGILIHAKIEGDGTLNAARDRPCVLHLQSREGTRSTTDTDCYVTYMPIDRINDHRSSIALKTMVDEQDSYVIP